MVESNFKWKVYSKYIVGDDEDEIYGRGSGRMLTVTSRIHTEFSNVKDVDSAKIFFKKRGLLLSPETGSISEAVSFADKIRSFLFILRDPQKSNTQRSLDAATFFSEFTFYENQFCVTLSKKENAVLTLNFKPTSLKAYIWYCLAKEIARIEGFKNCANILCSNLVPIGGHGGGQRNRIYCYESREACKQADFRARKKGKSK